MSLPLSVSFESQGLAAPAASTSQKGNSLKGQRLVGLIVALSVVIAGWFTVFISLSGSRLNFPLWDDWAFAKGFLGFLRGEGVHYWGWASMPELGQWIWASPFAEILGRNFVGLRLSTIAVALCGLTAFYDLLRKPGTDCDWPASFATASLGFCPLFFWLSGTFMTDVPALSFSLLALDSFSRAWRTEQSAWLAPATLFATLAGITRQNGVAVPLAVVILLVQRGGPGGKIRWWLAVLAPLGCTFVAAVLFSTRPDANPISIKLPSPRFVWLGLFIGAQIVAVSILPILALAPGRSKGGLVLACLLLAIALVVGISDEAWFPYLGNALPDAYKLVGLQEPMLIGHRSQQVLTVIASCAAGFLIGRLIETVRRGRQVDVGTKLLVRFSVAHAVLLLAAPRLYDRYFLVILPGAIAWILEAAHGARLRWFAGGAILLLYMALSVITTHDWYTWNSALWRLGRRAVAHGIRPRDIEGGTEWDGWHARRNAVRLTDDYYRPMEKRGLMLRFNSYLFPEATGKYAISASCLPRTQVIDSEPYMLWLFPGSHRFYLIQPDRYEP